MSRDRFMSRFAVRDEILQLDPERDHQRIVHLCACYEFPFDITRSLEFALFRTFCVPSISALLDRTGEFAARPQKRYDDTDIIISELIEWGYQSERGSRALARMNAIHSRFSITNEDYLYVLSTFIYEPVRWVDRFGWRQMCPQERSAFFHFWCEVGRRMGIHDIPSDDRTFERYNREYERDHFQFSETNERVGRATLELFVSWMPRPLAPVTRAVIHSLLEDRLIQAFGFPQPPSGLRRVVEAALKLRSLIVRVLPARRRPRLRSTMVRPSYPGGFTLEQLGPLESRSTS